MSELTCFKINSLDCKKQGIKIIEDIESKYGEELAQFLMAILHFEYEKR